MRNLTAAIEATKNGEIVILTDHPDRENEGDFVIAAEKITPEAINFMATHGRGLICLALEPKLIEKLNLPPMTEKNGSAFGTAFTISIEAKTGVTTGISAKDRTRTIEAAIHDDAKPSDLISPGHVFPLRARPHGTLERQGQTEGSVDLAKLAGLKGASVICEIMNEDGSMARTKELEAIAEKFNLKMTSVDEIRNYRNQKEVWLEKVSESELPTQEFGNFKMIGFRNPINGTEHIALVKNIKPQPLKAPLVRIHSECLTGEAFGSARCDCGDQLKHAMKLINDENAGIIIYHRAHEGRGIGLLNKIKAYHLQDQGLDTVEANLKLGFSADEREYSIANQVLKILEIPRVRLMTNNPKKIKSLQDCGIHCESVSIETEASSKNVNYLNTKKTKLGHTLDSIVLEERE